MISVGERLIQLREDNNLSKIEMAQRLEVNKSTITRYESNEIKPNLDMLIIISKQFGVSIDWLAGFDANQYHEYDPIIRECIQTGITPEKLKKIINTFREMINL